MSLPAPSEAEVREHPLKAGTPALHVACCPWPLSEACAARRRWEFLLAVAPLRLKNVTDSPVNRIALF